ncbi:hypothetical protein A9179_10855 [Pseudomonas alcaligenes]|uniref:DUF4019 domain-containing protein n=1 Tax=Aquipseudomonas alcaligenes TaxID=43263 RepID=A0ABR7RZL4_AQUAC|nr:hypothetical protein [Pseudomonas alcaligenes]MBC9250776.1 hypothetical protein [Pseudomonas alcaligenes]
MKSITSVILTVLISFSANVLAAEDYDGIPENFIKLIAAKKIPEAIDSLYPNEGYWSTPQGIAEKANISAKFVKFGDYRFHQLLSEKSIVDDRYVTLSYFVGFQNKPEFFSITLYKPENSWTAREFNFGGTPEETKNFSLPK